MKYIHTCIHKWMRAPPGHFKIPSWKFQEACGLYGNGINQPSTFGLPPCPSVKNPSANKGKRRCGFASTDKRFRSADA